MAVIPWPITRKNPNLSSAFLPALFSVIVRLLMKQTVMTRISKVSKIGNDKIRKNDTHNEIKIVYVRTSILHIGAIASVTKDGADGGMASSPTQAQ